MYIQARQKYSCTFKRNKGIDVHTRETTILMYIQARHQSLNREGRWGTTDDFATSFLHFSLFCTALLDLPNSRPVHSLMLSSNLFLCLSCLLPPFTVPCKMVLARPDERENGSNLYASVKLRRNQSFVITRPLVPSSSTAA